MQKFVFIVYIYGKLQHRKLELSNFYNNVFTLYGS